MSVSYTDVVIDSGQSLSDAIEIEGRRVIAIITPADIDSATAITFQASHISTGDFQNMYNNAGTEKSVTAAASRYIGLGPDDIISGAKAIKVRLGTAASPTTTTADRTLRLVLGSAY